MFYLSVRKILLFGMVKNLLLNKFELFFTIFHNFLPVIFFFPIYIPADRLHFNLSRNRQDLIPNKSKKSFV